jgi:hypothetical protein
MNLEPHSHHIVDFYELLNKAEEEAKSIRTKPKIDRYLQALENLNGYFVENHLWAVTWNTFHKYINEKGILTTLDSLAEFFHSEYPSVFLDEEFLDKLSNTFSDLRQEVVQSDLSKELKRSLVIHIEGLLRAISRYQIDGTEGLKKAAQTVVSDLMMTEHNIQDADIKNAKYTNFKSWVLTLLLFIAPTRVYDVIGAVPDIYSFWIPKFEELYAGQKKVEAIINDRPKLMIQEIIKNSSTIFDKEQQQAISGGEERKALLPSKDELENNPSDKEQQQAISGGEERKALLPSKDELENNPSDLKSP